MDNVGLVNQITSFISKERNVNMKSISFESEGGVFEGKIMLYVDDKKHLSHLISHLKKFYGIEKVERIEL